jgi:hypothetical protein
VRHADLELGPTISRDLESDLFAQELQTVKVNLLASVLLLDKIQSARPVYEKSVELEQVKLPRPAFDGTSKALIGLMNENTRLAAENANLREQVRLGLEPTKEGVRFVAYSKVGVPVSRVAGLSSLLLAVVIPVITGLFAPSIPFVLAAGFSFYSYKFFQKESESLRAKSS